MSREDVVRDYEEYKSQGRIWGQVPVERISRIKFPRTDAAIIERYLTLPDLTTTVSDMLDGYGVRGAIPASYIKPLQIGKKIVGNAVTLRSLPERKTATQAGFDKDPMRMSTRDIYYLSEPGDVLVADFGGNRDVSALGGQSALLGKTCGLVGAIVNGAVRDLPAMREMEFPLWAAGVTPITGKFRIEAMEVNGPVTVHDIVVYAGDLVVADDSGICVVPQELVIRLLEEAEKVAATEDKMRDLLAKNPSISELRSLVKKRYEA